MGSLTRATLRLPSQCPGTHVSETHRLAESVRTQWTRACASRDKLLLSFDHEEVQFHDKNATCSVSDKDIEKNTKYC